MSPALMRAMLELPPLFISKDVMPRTVGIDWIGQSESRIHRSGSNELTGHGCTFMVIDDPVKDEEVFPKRDATFLGLTKQRIEEARKQMSRAVEREIGRQYYGVTIQNP